MSTNSSTFNPPHWQQYNELQHTLKVNQQDTQQHPQLQQQQHPLQTYQPTPLPQPVLSANGHYAPGQPPVPQYPAPLTVAVPAQYQLNPSTASSPHTSQYQHTPSSVASSTPTQYQLAPQNISGQPPAYYPPGTIMVPLQAGSGDTHHLSQQSHAAISVPSTYFTQPSEVMLVPTTISAVTHTSAFTASDVEDPLPKPLTKPPPTIAISPPEDVGGVMLPIDRIDISQNAPRRPKLGPDLEATCPLLGAIPRGGILPHPLPISSLKANAQVSIATCVVEFELEVVVPAWVKSSHRLVFYSPRQVQTTTTHLSLVNKDWAKPQIATMTLIPREEVQQRGWGRTRPQLDYNEEGGPDKNDPELFIYNVPYDFQYKPGHRLKLSLMYFEPLQFLEGSYILRLPTTIPAMCIPQQSSVQSILQVSAVVNTGLPTDVDVRCLTHPTTEESAEPGVVGLVLDRSQVLMNLDFELSYQVWGPVITAACYVMPPRYQHFKGVPPPENHHINAHANGTIDPSALPPRQPHREVPLLSSGAVDHLPTFILTAAPQNPDCCDAFPRSVVFLLDRSGSMTGEPLAFAIQAILSGMKLLDGDDQFTICAFDHEQLWWDEELRPATEENISDAGSWMLANVTARGLTDILTPLSRSIELLQGFARQLPFVFLMTDGCVQEEREICNLVESLIGSGEAIGKHRPRINTFAIGPYANHFFLSLVASMARGFFDVAFRPYSIQPQMERMLLACARPNLSDIQVTAPGMDGNHVALLPSPIPDLFCGRPMMVIGKFDGEWPGRVVLSGVLPEGRSWDQEVVSSKSDLLPLDKIWAKEYLHRETAVAWRKDDREAIDRIINTSIATGVPCAYTQMVGFTTTPEGYQQLQEDRQRGQMGKVTKYAIGGTAGLAIVVGAAAVLSFGDIANTMANIPSDILAGFGDFGDCCGCCGECCGAVGGCSIS